MTFVTKMKQNKLKTNVRFINMLVTMFPGELKGHCFVVFIYFMGSGGLSL